MAEHSQLAANSAESSTTEQAEPDRGNRRRPRVRFRLRTLLLLPLMVAALLLVAFPKLITGDFVDVTISSINERSNGVTIEMDALASSKTGWGATNALHGGSLGVSGGSQSRWTDIIPTWPRHETIIVNLRFNQQNLWPKPESVADLILIEEGETYRVTPERPLDIARARYINGQVGHCKFGVTRGSRLGL